MTSQDAETLCREWATRLVHEPDALTILFSSGGRHMKIELAPCGELLVRENGGPHHHMGMLDNFESSSVSAWRAAIDSQRHRAMLRGLAEAGFPVGADAGVLVPDERPSWIGVRHAMGPSAHMSASHCALEESAALESIVNELDSLCYVLSNVPATELIPNPELDQWSSGPRRGPMIDGLSVTAPTGSNRALAQKAVDEFYRTYVPSAP